MERAKVSHVWRIHCSCGTPPVPKRGHARGIALAEFVRERDGIATLHKRLYGAARARGDTDAGFVLDVMLARGALFSGWFADHQMHVLSIRDENGLGLDGRPFPVVVVDVSTDGVTIAELAAMESVGFDRRPPAAQLPSPGKECFRCGMRACQCP